MKVIVCGGRDYADRKRVWQELDRLPRKDLFIIEGGAIGADRLARKWCIERVVAFETVEAEWDEYGHAAGPIRNAEMLKRQPDMVLAFPGHTGTADMIRQAHAAGVRVEIVW